MNISVNKLVTKIEEELMQAKTSTKVENLREKIYSIKILCELILEEQQGQNEKSLHKISPVSQTKKLEINDEANGDSLLDF